jgi:uncharacterized protein (DUF1684 family)
MRLRNSIALSCLILLVMDYSLSCGGSGEARMERSAFERAELEWRAERDERMKGPTSWLTIAGLFWLQEGTNGFGAGHGNTIRLPEGSAPERAGVIVLHNEEVTVIAEDGASVMCNDSTITEMKLKSDADGVPDVLRLNDLRMWIIKRGDRFALRLRDLNEPRYKNCRGLDFFPPKLKYRVEADFVPFAEPKTITLATAVGMETEIVSPGYVSFALDGKPLRLDVFGDGHDAGELFIIFKDETSGGETYGACRFLVAGLRENGSVELNFNRAYNPPCAYTPYATCPLPPPQNELPVAIRAGEKQYRKGH